MRYTLTFAPRALADLEKIKKSGDQARIKYKFTTLEEETGIEEVNAAANLVGSSKLLHDGQLYILRDGKIFNAQGARVK